MDTRKLVIRAQSGDHSSLGELYKTYDNLVRRSINKCCRHQEINDISQDVWLLAWKHIKQLRDPNRFSQWLYSIVKSQCRLQYRQYNRRTCLPLLDKDLAKSEKKSSTTVDLSNLTEYDRALLLDKYYLGKRLKQIMEERDWTIGRVKKQLYEARLRARRLLRKQRFHID
jgi:RNA polymerase sigma-70 factor (ECF subfamily)